MAEVERDLRENPGASDRAADADPLRPRQPGSHSATGCIASRASGREWRAPPGQVDEQALGRRKWGGQQRVGNGGDPALVVDRADRIRERQPGLHERSQPTPTRRPPRIVISSPATSSIGVPSWPARTATCGPLERNASYTARAGPRPTESPLG